MTRVIPFPVPHASRPARDLLILEFLHLVRIAARAVKRRLPPSFELDDLVGEGTLGLIAAADTYDAAKGPFKIRAQFMINTAILESVRRRNWTANTMEQFESIHRGNLSVLEDGSSQACQDTAFEPLREKHTESEDQLAAGIDERRKQKVLSFAIAGLRPRYRDIINSHYRSGRPIAAHAKTLGIEVSRGSQLHHEALRALAMALRESGVRVEYADLRAAVVPRPARCVVARNAA